MLKQLFSSFSVAIDNVKARFFHTLLSIVGIVIGVAALVTILSLVDGMQQYARGQITTTTSLKAIVINSNSQMRVNKVWIDKKGIDVISYEDFQQLKKDLTEPYDRTLFSTRTSSEFWIENHEDTLATVIVAKSYFGEPKPTLLYGREISEEDVALKRPVAIINELLAKEIQGEGDLSVLIGKTLKTPVFALEIVGIAKAEKARYGITQMPVSLLSPAQIRKNPPQVAFEAKDVENIAPLKQEIETWLTQKYKRGLKDFTVVSDVQRVAQAEKGFLLFKVIMGLIVGVSVLVGGIGVMNVLLISIKERTKEIGVCKAVGAKRNDILWQFLAESVSISTLGSILGLIVGILGTLLIVPIVKMIVDVPFQAVYTWSTLVVVGVVAILVGITFGTYPAIQAAKLNPVDAIRKE